MVRQKQLDNETEWFYHVVKAFQTELKKEAKQMKLDRQKFELECARACICQRDFISSGISKATLSRALSCGVKPATLSRIARSLGVDVLDILEDSSEEGE